MVLSYSDTDFFEHVDLRGFHANMKLVYHDWDWVVKRSNRLFELS